MTRFVVALPIEARPFVRRFGLRRDPSHSAFPVFASDRHSLIVTGIGKVAAAAGVSYLQLAVPAGPAEPWINVGIAGHATRSRGEVVRAAKIEDASTGESWFPPLVVRCTAPSETIRTVATVEREYDRNCAYEMEASGFYPSASRFVSGELVQCIKVISDGPGAGQVESIDRDLCRRLIENELGLVENLAEELEVLARPLQEELADPPQFSEIMSAWRFTVSQRNQVRSLLGGLAARPAAGKGLELPKLVDATAVIAHLRLLLDARPLGFEEDETVPS